LLQVQIPGPHAAILPLNLLVLDAIEAIPNGPRPRKLQPSDLLAPVSVQWDELPAKFEFPRKDDSGTIVRTTAHT